MSDLGGPPASRRGWLRDVLNRLCSCKEARREFEEDAIANRAVRSACTLGAHATAMSVLSPRIGATLPRLVHGPVRDIVTSALRLGPLPAHIALVMDGNRRLARREGIQTLRGHELGFEALKGVRCAGASHAR